MRWVILVFVLILMGACKPTDQYQVNLNSAASCGHIEIQNVTTGEVHVIHMNDLRSQEPTSDIVVQQLRKYIEEYKVDVSKLDKVHVKDILESDDTQEKLLIIMPLLDLEK